MTTSLQLYTTVYHPPWQHHCNSSHHNHHENLTITLHNHISVTMTSLQLLPITNNHDNLPATLHNHLSFTMTSSWQPSMTALYQSQFFPSTLFLSHNDNLTVTVLSHIPSSWQPHCNSTQPSMTFIHIWLPWQSNWNSYIAYNKNLTTTLHSHL